MRIRYHIKENIFTYHIGKYLSKKILKHGAHRQKNIDDMVVNFDMTNDSTCHASGEQMNLITY